jgi:hypothetical protein
MQKCGTCGLLEGIRQVSKLRIPPPHRYQYFPIIVLRNCSFITNINSHTYTKYLIYTYIQDGAEKRENRETRKFEVHVGSPVDVQKVGGKCQTVE